MREPIDSYDNLEMPRGLNRGQERRLQFIDFRLHWEGRINRTDLTEYFGLSVPQASLDISKYLEIAPNNLKYDKSSKTYNSTNDFKPLYQRSSAHRYLGELLAIKAGIIEPGNSFIGSVPEMDWALPPWRSINELTVAAMVKAIHQMVSIKVSYQSMSSMDASVRILSPHALGHDGFRWHVRAYCHKRERFSDFVLARILKIHGFEPSTINMRNDLAWHTKVTLLLGPHPELPPSKKRVIELDYGMVEGEAKLVCRQAFLFYTLRRLGLLNKEAPDPIAQQIILKNRDEIQPYLEA